MFNISAYLEKFKNLGQGERFLKQTILLAIKEVLGLDIETKDVVVKNGEILLKVSPAIKNTIFIKKKDILAKILEKTDKNLTNIR